MALRSSALESPLRPFEFEPMLRRARALVPLLAAAAALLGAALSDRPVVAVLIAVVAAFAVQAGLDAVAERRLRATADHVAGLVHAAPTARLRQGGSREWRRLADALDTVAETLRDRFAELGAERARVERLVDGLPTPVLFFADDRLAFANPAAQELFSVGRSAEWSPLRVLGEGVLVAAVSEAREAGRPVDVEVSRDGRELVAHAAEVAAGEVALIVTDVTEARRLESVRRDFVANASHELKTPATAMQALADSLAMALERDPDRARTMVESLRGEAIRLSRLVRDLLDLTRLEEADERARQRLDLTAVAAAQVERLSTMAARREVTLVGVDGPDVGVVATPTDLRLIVGNLVANAVQYNQPGGTVTVRVWRAGAQVFLEVSDDGIGIPEEDRERIFERFYRVDKARSRAAGGTGLGLSLVRNAVQRLGGQVQLHSVLGEGSVFTVVLPVEGSP